MPRPQVGGASFSAKHANFVENAGDATTADILELMAEGRRRVHERFGVELEPEVQVLGEVRWPDGLGARLMGARPLSGISLPEMPSWPVLRRRLLMALAIIVVIGAAYMFWFRNSSFVQVERVEVVGAARRLPR